MGGERRALDGVGTVVGDHRQHRFPAGDDGVVADDEVAVQQLRGEDAVGQEDDGCLAVLAWRAVTLDPDREGAPVPTLAQRHPVGGRHQPVVD